MSSEEDWAHLPEVVAQLVLDKLFETIDRIKFGVVCTNWHRIAEEYKEQSLVHQNQKKHLPLLMIPATNNHNKRRLYSIAEGRMYPIHLSVRNEICIGSCYNGWLAFANHEKLVITLMNPFEKVEPIELPPLEFDDCMDSVGSSFKIKKVILSADPSACPNNYVVIVIYGGNGRLALFKSGKKKWGKIVQPNLCLFTDLIFYKNIFYAVTNFCGVFSFDLNSIENYDKPIKPQVNELIESGNSRIPRVYLVESSKGELLMVQRSFLNNAVKRGKRKTNNIKVHNLVLDATSGTLIDRVEISSLDGDAIFVGFNYSWSICALEFPKCIANSIYFTNDFFQKYNSMDGPCDLGFYNMEEESFGEHYKLNRSDGYFKPPIWVLPPV